MRKQREEKKKKVYPFAFGLVGFIPSRIKDIFMLKVSGIGRKKGKGSFPLNLKTGP